MTTPDEDQPPTVEEAWQRLAGDIVGALLLPMVVLVAQRLPDLPPWVDTAVRVMWWVVIVGALLVPHN